MTDANRRALGLPPQKPWLRVTDGAVPVGGVDYVSTRDDDEYFTYEWGDIGVCIGEYLDALEDPSPGTIELFGFARNTVTRQHVAKAAEAAYHAVLEYFEDVENGIAHVDPYDASDMPLKLPHRGLWVGLLDVVNSIADDVFVWQCTHVVTWEVDVAEWRRINGD